ncbi:MAG: VOC family protein [Candidatus Tectimicrobiota bacterium]
MSNPAFIFDHIHLISPQPQETAHWYVQMFGADIVANKIAYGAPQIFLELGGKTLVIRGSRAGEDPVPARPIQPYANFSSHNAWGTDHFGFVYHGDLRAFCEELRAKGVRFPVALKEGVGGKLLCYVSAPDGVSIELMQG